MKQRVYIETTIVSYLTSKPSRDLIVAAHQAVTREWWAEHRTRYDLCASQFVLDEAREGDTQAAADRLAMLAGLPLVSATDQTMAVAMDLVKHGLLPPKAATDAVHLAIATLNRLALLLTWNCRHLANASVMVEVGRYLRNNGYEPPVVCTPDELMNDVDEPGELER